MDYMTLKEAAEKWGVTPRRVNYYCAGFETFGADVKAAREAKRLARKTLAEMGRDTS